MKSTLYGIGVGPGDKELLTVKAVRAIENSDVVVAPSAMEGGESIALETAKEYIKEGTEVVIKHFPMGKKNRIENNSEKNLTLHTFLFYNNSIKEMLADSRNGGSNEVSVLRRRYNKSN